MTRMPILTKQALSINKYFFWHLGFKRMGKVGGLPLLFTFIQVQTDVAVVSQGACPSMSYHKATVQGPVAGPRQSSGLD